MIQLVSACSYMYLLLDFARGWWIRQPILMFPAAKTSSPPPKTIFSSLPFRVVLMLVPQMIRFIEPYISTKYRNIPYLESASNDPIHQLDIIVTKQHVRTDRRPVFIFLHGGAWLYGSKNYLGLVHVNNVASLGWVAVTVNYRFVECNGVQMWSYLCIAYRVWMGRVRGGRRTSRTSSALSYG